MTSETSRPSQQTGSYKEWYIAPPKNITVNRGKQLIYSKTVNNSEGCKYDFGYFCGRVQEFSDGEEEAGDDGEVDGSNEGRGVELSLQGRQEENLKEKGLGNLEDERTNVALQNQDSYGLLSYLSI